MADIVDFPNKGLPPEKLAPLEINQQCSNADLMQTLVEVLVELKRRAGLTEFQHVSLTDVQGRKWALTGLLQLCQNYLTHLILSTKP